MKIKGTDILASKIYPNLGTIDWPLAESKRIIVKTKTGRDIYYITLKYNKDTKCFDLGIREDDSVETRWSRITIDEIYSEKYLTILKIVLCQFLGDVTGYNRSRFNGPVDCSFKLKDGREVNIFDIIFIDQTVSYSLSSERINPREVDSAPLRWMGILEFLSRYYYERY